LPVAAAAEVLVPLPLAVEEEVLVVTEPVLELLVAEALQNLRYLYYLVVVLQLLLALVEQLQIMALQEMRPYLVI
jgi:hypothetical protein